MLPKKHSFTKKKIILLFLFLLVTGTSTFIIFLSARNQKTTQGFVSTQESTLISFTTSAIKVGLSHNLLDYARQTFQQLQSNEYFHGGIIFDADETPLLAIPHNFVLPQPAKLLLERMKEPNHADHANLLEKGIDYKIQILKAKKEVLGYLVLSFNNSTLSRAEKISMLYTVALGLSLILVGWLTIFFLNRYITLINVQNKELEEEKIKAQESDRLKTEFLAMTSHELRTPMNGILGISEVLLDMSLSDDERDCVQSIHYSARSLLALLNDILDFSKIEAGEMELELISMDLHASIKEIVHLMSHTASKKGLPLILDIDANVPHMVIGDPSRLRQILQNLVGNAIKFTETGHIRLNVSAAPVEDGKQMVLIEVEDTGLGIPPQAQGFVFDKFRQASSSTTRRYGGTGLGLAIVKHLVTIMGGDISLESEENKGSVFRVGIPFALVATDALLEENKTATHADAGESSGKVDYAGRNVLIVDDHPINAIAMRKMLERMGFATIATANNGQEGVEAAAKQNFDLIMMDCQMPIMDGYEATQKIREKEARQPEGKKAVIIAITADAMKGAHNKCIAAGMNDYISKPISQGALVEVICRYLEPSGIAREGQGAAQRKDVFRLSRSWFLAHTSHEIHMHMSTITDLAQKLCAEDLKTAQKVSVQEILSIGSSVLPLLNDLRDLSKIETWEVVIEKSAFNFKITIQNIINLLTPMARQKGFALNFAYDAETPEMVVGDPLHLGQVITNIVGNAIQFTETGGVTVNVSAETPKNDKNPYAFQITVQDTGIGMSEEQQKTILGVSNRVTPSSARKAGEGEGLGLVISAELIERMHGQIICQSVAGEGSTFTIKVPLPLARDTQDAPAHSDYSKFRILIADDHPTNLMFMSKLLKRMGFVTVDTAQNGSEVLQKVLDNPLNPYHIIFLDAQMPEMDGIETCRRLRELEQSWGSHTTVIAVTANILSSDKENFLEAGIDDYLTKPVKPEMFEKTIQHWLFGVLINIESAEEQRKAEAPVNMEYMNILTDNNREEEIAVADVFLDVGQECLDVMERHVAANDASAQDWGTAAHKMKGSAAQLGAYFLEDACRRAVEAQEASIEEKKPLLRKVKEEYDNVRKFLMGRR